MSDLQNTGTQRRSRQQTPERVENAAEAMRNTASHGAFRGYVPPQQTGPYTPPRQQTGAYPPLSQQTGVYANPGQGNMNAQNPYYASAAKGGQRGYVNTAAPGKEKAEQGKKSHTGKIVVAVLIALAVIAGATFGGYTLYQNYQHDKTISEKISPYNNLFCPGVYVDGISLGGMTPDQAMNSVQSQINQRNDAWKVQLTYNGSVVADITTKTLNMNIDQNELVNLMNNAWLQGHSGNDEERYDAMLALEQTPYVAYTARPNGDTGEIDKLLEQLKSRIDQPATDAKFLSFDPSLPYPFTFQEESTGRRLDIQPILDELYQMVSTMKSGIVELKPEILEPSVHVADLQKHYMLRSTATTPIDKHSPENRNSNIRRAFELINGYVLQPGKTFSFNNVVGERTLENGFLTAIEYAYDEHVEGVGGGVCQASTTVYQAAVCAGLQILRRRPHSDSVSYTEYGRDATVYWYKGRKIDLQFKNNTDDPIYIVAQVTEDPSNKKRLITKVSMYGQDMGDVRYELVAEVIETLPAILDPVYVKDKESAAKAKEGYVVKSYRIQYTAGVMTERKELFTDTYNPKPEKIYLPE